MTVHDGELFDQFVFAILLEIWRMCRDWYGYVLVLSDLCITVRKNQDEKKNIKINGVCVHADR